jgi:hypothetical protein
VWQEGKSEGMGQSGWSEVEIEAGPMGRLQAGVSGGGAAGEDKRDQPVHTTPKPRRTSSISSPS